MPLSAHTPTHSGSSHNEIIEFKQSWVYIHGIKLPHSLLTPPPPLFFSKSDRIDAHDSPHVQDGSELFDELFEDHDIVEQVAERDAWSRASGFLFFIVVDARVGYLNLRPSVLVALGLRTVVRRRVSVRSWLGTQFETSQFLRVCLGRGYSVAVYVCLGEYGVRQVSAASPPAVFGHRQKQGR